MQYSYNRVGSYFHAEFHAQTYRYVSSFFSANIKSPRNQSTMKKLLLEVKAMNPSYLAGDIRGMFGFSAELVKCVQGGIMQTNRFCSIHLTKHMRFMHLISIEVVFCLQLQ